MPAAAPSWVCIDCSTRYPTRVAWCSYCSAMGRVVLLGQRPSAAMDAEVEVADAASLSALAGDPVPVAAYPALLVAHGTLVVVTGPPAGGKSTFASRWLNATAGPVLYVSHEEGLGATLASRLKRLGITRRDFRLLGRANVDQVVAEVRRSKPVALAIDSVQSGVWEPSDLRHLLALHPRLGLVLAIGQVNAKGVPEGRRALIHEADVAIHVEDSHASLTKSRHQEITDGTLRLPVLPRTDVGGALRREGATVLHLHLVQRPHLPARDAEPRGDRDGVAADRSDGRGDEDQPRSVAADAGDEGAGRTEPPNDIA